MAIPASDRVEYVVSATGNETFPQSVFAKSSFWTVQFSYGSLLLNNYGGNLIEISQISCRAFFLTPAFLPNRTIDTNKFWLWTISNLNSLDLYEVEPFPSIYPTVTFIKNVSTNVSSASAYLKENDYFRVIILSTANPKVLRAQVYYNILDPDAPISTVLNSSWPLTRLTSLSNSVNSDSTSLDLSYLDTSSPPNVYTESYTVPVPTNFVGSLVINTFNISLSWDVSVGSDNYLLQRALDSGFTTGVMNVYDGPLISFLDITPGPNTYYYRLKAQDTFLEIESIWTGTVTVTIPMFVAEFTRVPDTGPVPLSVDFVYTGDTVPGAIYAWDFDDGNYSSVQNPSHTFTSINTFDVSLTVSTVYSGLIYEAGLPTSVSTRSTKDICCNGGRIFLSQNSYGIAAYTFVPGAPAQLSLLWQVTDSGIKWDLYCDNTYIYLGNHTKGLYVYTAATGIRVGVNTTYASGVWGNGSVIFTASSNYLRAWTINPSNPEATFLIAAGSIQVSPTYQANTVIGFGSYIIVGAYNGLYAFTYSAGTFTPVASITTPGWIVGGLEVTPSYILVASATGLKAFTFNGSSFTQVGSYPAGSGYGYKVYYDGTRVFFANGTDQLRVFTIDALNPSFFIEQSSTADTLEHLAVRGDGTNVYDGVVTSVSAGIYNSGMTAYRCPTTYSDSVSHPVDVLNNFVADFIADVTSGNSPLAVQFTDLSSGSPTSWEWDFGDGISSISRLQNPRHYYTRPGTYTVTMTIRNGLQVDTLVRTAYINVAGYLIDFIGTPRSGPQPLTVQFTEILQNINPDEIEWTFGDGQAATGHNPEHVYRNSGRYTVQMLVRVNM